MISMAMSPDLSGDKHLFQGLAARMPDAAVPLGRRTEGVHYHVRCTYRSIIHREIKFL